MYKNIFQHTDLLRFPWDLLFKNISKGTVTSAGNAIHPMTSDLGQSDCSVLEDVVVLGRHIGKSLIKHGRVVHCEAAIGIEKYVKERWWRTAGLITGLYLSGYVPFDGNGWWMKFFRDIIFYRYLFHRLLNPKYDRGKLPNVCPNEEIIEASKKE